MTADHHAQANPQPQATRSPDSDVQGSSARSGSAGERDRVINRGIIPNDESGTTLDVTAFLEKVVSGGQTGVDRGALEAAIALGIDHGGWCPRGRLSEDGSIPSRYQLVEMDRVDYPARTEQNVIDSDATLILYEGKLKGGTLLTRRMARKWQKPYLCERMVPPAESAVRTWLAENRPSILNVAGPRESSCPGIGERSMAFLLSVFR